MHRNQTCSFPGLQVQQTEPQPCAAQALLSSCHAPAQLHHCHWQHKHLSFNMLKTRKKNIYGKNLSQSLTLLRLAGEEVSPCRPQSSLGERGLGYWELIPHWGNSGSAVTHRTPSPPRLHTSCPDQSCSHQKHFTSSPERANLHTYTKS